MMISTPLRLGVLCLVPVLTTGAAQSRQAAPGEGEAQAASMRRGENRPTESTLDVHYLEIVTASVDETCEALAKAHGVTFSEPNPALANARTAQLKSGGRIGVRGLLGQEQPVVRPYMLVDDIQAAIKAAVAAGAEVMMAPTEIAGEGTFAIYYLGKIEHGLWQL